MKALAAGDLIQLVEIPEQVIRDRENHPETYHLFELALGRHYRIRSFNDYAMAEIWLNDDASEDTLGIHHSLWVEEAFLRRS